MQPSPGFIELPTDVSLWTSVAPLPEHVSVRAANRATDKKRKKETDDKERKKREKERVKLQRGKRQQGSSSSEEDEDEEEDEEIPWDYLSRTDEDLPLPQKGPFHDAFGVGGGWWLCLGIGEPLRPV